MDRQKRKDRVNYERKEGKDEASGSEEEARSDHGRKNDSKDWPR